MPVAKRDKWEYIKGFQLFYTVKFFGFPKGGFICLWFSIQRSTGFSSK